MKKIFLLLLVMVVFLAGCNKNQQGTPQNSETENTEPYVITDMFAETNMKEIRLQGKNVEFTKVDNGYRIATDSTLGSIEGMYIYTYTENENGETEVESVVFDSIHSYSTMYDKYLSGQMTDEEMEAFYEMNPADIPKDKMDDVWTVVEEYYDIFTNKYHVQQFFGTYKSIKTQEYIKTDMILELDELKTEIEKCIIGEECYQIQFTGISDNGHTYVLVFSGLDYLLEATIYQY